MEKKFVCNAQQTKTLHLNGTVATPVAYLCIIRIALVLGYALPNPNLEIISLPYRNH